MSKTLYFFTRHYPYHEHGEAFIEREILFLSKEFEKIIIFPSNKHKYCRKVPVNVTVNDLFIDNTASFSSGFTLYIQNFFLLLITVLTEIKSKGISNFFKNIEKYLRLLLIQLVRYDRMKKFLEEKNETIEIAYDYWFINSTLALCYLKKEGFIDKLITRSHKMDVFDEVQKDTGIPFRNYQIELIDKMYTISHFNKNYFKNKFREDLIDKISVSYLGVKNGPLSKQAFPDSDIKVIVSCANMHEHKNIHLIPETLKNVKTKVKWIHFGKGDFYSKVEEQIKELPDNVTVELKGSVLNETIIKFYSEQQVDLFLSLSSSEGIPVSMMEAMANNIPILAYAIDGVPEIVVDNITGKLFYNINNFQEIAQFIDESLAREFNKDKIKSYFLENFHESDKYEKFAKEIASL